MSSPGGRALAILPGEGDNLQPLPWRRMAWVTWRQHRGALAGVGALLGALAIYVSIAGLSLHHAYAAAIACHPASSYACGVLANSFNGTDDFLANGAVFQPLPPLIGAFVGAPLLARELETGTFRFTFTQGFERRRWTLAKVVALAIVLAGATGAFSALLSWYYQPYLAPGNQALGLRGANPFTVGLFDLRGVAFAAWTVFAFAAGALAGVLARRVVPAIAATLALYAGAAVATGLYLREHYLAPVLTSMLNVPGGVWVLSEQWLTRGGRPVRPSVLGQVLQGAPLPFAGKGGVPQSLPSWQYLVRHGYTLQSAFQPVGRFWPFQWIEGSWLVAISAVFLALTVWMVRRRAT